MTPDPSERTTPTNTLVAQMRARADEYNAVADALNSKIAPLEEQRDSYRKTATALLLAAEKVEDADA